MLALPKPEPEVEPVAPRIAALDADADRSFDRRRARIFRPVAVVAVVALLLLAVIAMQLVASNDRETREHEQAMVARGLALRMHELEQAVIPQVEWDEAVDHLGNRLDRHWADAYFAVFMHSQVGATRAFVLQGDGRPVYGARDGKPTNASPDAIFAPFAPAAEAMLPGLRQREAPAHQPPVAGQALAHAVHTTALARAEGQVWIVSAHLIQPDGGKVKPREGPLSIAMVAIPLDAPMLRLFGQRYRIADMVVTPMPPRDDTMARILLKGLDGADLGWMVWSPQRPGSALLREIAAPLIMLLVAFSWGSWIFVREASQMTRELIDSEALARHVAYHDTLTGLPNRALMFDRLSQLLAIARRNTPGFPADLAVHCLDLDRFKEVNDTLGHHAGDELIRKVGAILKELCRESDTVARLGGDEFVILQPGTTAAGASHLAARILRELSRPIDLTFGQVEISASIGVTMVSDPKIESSDVLRQADLALYAAKEAGRNGSAFFEPEMDAALRLRRALEGDLRQAMALGQIHMAYQPQIDRDGRVVSVEALVRWQHPTKGAISPTVLVPLAEESGLVHELGEYILRRVFEETREWPGLRVAVNVSALQLRSPVFMAMVTRLVAEYDIDPRHYEFEITETALLGDDGVTRNNLTVLSQEGFTIALDDFGTGYASLTNLHRFAIDKIKIDRSFVQNLDSGEEAEALIDAIVRLGRALGLDIVAEGVETESQRRRLALCGCNHFQGYLVSRPVGARELEKMIPGR
ncbi:putative bifunctional diguanylate cyclase/phosphodiesterase [Novosphingobium rosa]|uniref:putative bifunctional diguanylate cyclase/phosphodiesterase n=1 Tax=Novosphingobium rosa TaxID=76978 RepID=UPI00082F7F1E|nr:EAL domain-containing protein [Novosphingobium rosa]